MKAITPKRTLIHCDTCHHEFTGDPTEWLHKPCPECGAPDIITDDDMAAWRGIPDVPLCMLLADFWTGQWPTSEVPGDEGDPIDAPPDEDPSSLYREAYYAGMADGPVPGTD